MIHTTIARPLALGVVMAILALAMPAAAEPTPSPGHNILAWPMPETVSPQGRAAVAAAASAPLPDPAPPLPVVRQVIDAMQSAMGAELTKRYEVRVEESTIAGVPVRIVYPKGVASLAGRSVLLNLHGGGGKLDSGSLTETIPMAGLTGIPVVAVLYRLAPENPYPARLDDALAVYSALEKERPSSRLAVYGTSAGAVLSGQLLAKLKSLGRPMPRALGFFAGTADASRKGDSESWVPMPGGELAPETQFGVALTDPVLSPIYSDLAGFPPTLLVTSTRDLALSGTSNFGRALVEHGVDARLVVFDGMPHAFWTYLQNIPETEAANALMAAFFKDRLSPKP
ncbi:MAG: alpha/beta hydrolase [Tsuneonella sp.]